MIKVAFWYDRPQEYTGGLNYMRNLLYALSTMKDRKISPYVFFGHQVDAEVVRSFEPLATVVRTSVLDRKSLSWYVHQILFRCFGSLLAIERILRRNGIAILSHADRVYGKSRPFRIISWIPDFQYLHLPELFPLDPGKESDRMRAIATQSDALILSSHSALADYRRIADTERSARVHVLQFVSQPSLNTIKSKEPRQFADLEKKYGFNGPYFFLPNQFWEHKNHATAFAAVKTLKERGIETLLLCSGNLRDYRVRHTAYVDTLREFIENNRLHANVRILGLIDYADVLLLMRHSVATINPSRFEGWSSTVEEARSMGKRLILSRIPVHMEQNPPAAAFFDPDDATELADIMAHHWAAFDGTISAREMLEAEQDLQQRTTRYAEGYARVVLEVARKPS